MPVAADLDRVVGKDTTSHPSDATDDLLPPGPPWLHRVDLVVLAALAVAAVVVRFATRSPLWLDEALSVNIAGLPLSDIPRALRSDGHPPLYYFLLHGWIEVFGDSPVAVRALSGAFALALFPLLWLAGRRLGGRRVAAAALIVLAVSPYAIRYATEARMYSMMMVLAVAGYLLGESVLRRLRARSVVGLALVTGALLWTHYWGMWVLAAAGLGMAGRWWLLRRQGRSEDARRSLVVVGALVAGGLTFVPWLPSLLYQSERTGTPWGEPEGPFMVVRSTVVDLGGGPGATGTVGGLLLAGLVLLGLVAIARSRHRLALWLPAPSVRRVALLFGLAVVIAQVVSYATGATYESRYLAPVVPLLLLLGGRGLAQVTHPIAFRAVVVVLVVLGLLAAERNLNTPRSQAREAASAIEVAGSPDDLVVVCPDQLGPSLTRELDGYEVVSDPVLAPAARVNWVDYQARLDAHPPEEVAAEVMRRAEGRQLWVVWSGAYPLTHRARCYTLVDAIFRERPWGREVVQERYERYEHEAVIRFPSSP